MEREYKILEAACLRIKQLTEAIPTMDSRIAWLCIAYPLLAHIVLKMLKGEAYAEDLYAMAKKRMVENAH